MKFADGCVKEVLDELEKDFPGKATLFVVSDHGFRRYSRLIQANVTLRQAGLLTTDGKQIRQKPCYALSSPRAAPPCSTCSIGTTGMN